MTEPAQKAAHDARQHFSELLVKLIESIVSASSNQDLAQWELLLLNYYSLTQRYIRAKPKAEIQNLMNKLCNLKKHQPSRGYQKVKTPWELNAGLYLMELQILLFDHTSTLLLPSVEDDLSEFFDPGKEGGLK